MRPIAKMGMLSPALLWLVTGCAETKPAYVVPAPAARGVDVAEARGGDAAGSRPDPQLDQRMSAMEGRINDMNQRLDKVDGAVAGAQSRADEAAKKAEGVNSRLTRLWSNRFNQKVSDSLEVYFPPDSIELSDAAQTALLSVVKEMQAHPTLTVELGGYTDPRGALDYNYALSQRRVDSVRKFLMEKGIQLGRIQAASLGPISDSNIPDIKKRRVTVRLMADQE
ncbi:MAG TPA: OmpA family protein [Methylomirabilota bacterium]|nr:OmpA family protein [Methylomirabilota bacterium]